MVFCNIIVQSFVGINGSCNGTNQSPISLSYGKGETIIRNDWLPFQFIDYDNEPYKMYIENNGHTAQITYDAATCSHIPTIIQGGLTGITILALW